MIILIWSYVSVNLFLQVSVATGAIKQNPSIPLGDLLSALLRNTSTSEDVLCAAQSTNNLKYLHLQVVISVIKWKILDLFQKKEGKSHE